jgi:diacylglycerol kinase family enzyme
MRAALVLNSRAGTLLARPDLPDAIATALAAHFDLTVIPDDRSLDARLDAAIETGAELIVLGGGDGSVRCAAEKLIPTDRVLGILPLGTLNLMARDLLTPLEPMEAVQALIHGHPQRVDAGSVNGHVFVCQSVIGLPNLISRHRERVRGKMSFGIALRLLRIGIRTFLRHPPMRLALRYRRAGDGDPGFKRVWIRALSVVNNAYADAPGQMFHRPRLDGGELVIYRPRSFGIAWALRMLLAMSLGRWRRQQQVEVLPIQELTLLSQRRHLSVMNDGEASIIATPLEYRLLPKALTVMMPRAARAGEPQTGLAQEGVAKDGVPKGGVPKGGVAEDSPA